VFAKSKWHKCVVFVQKIAFMSCMWFWNAVDWWNS